MNKITEARKSEKKLVYDIHTTMVHIYIPYFCTYFGIAVNKQVGKGIQVKIVLNRNEPSKQVLFYQLIKVNDKIP